MDINFTIEKGEFVFLTGASGAGKSTLLKLIFKEELPTKGQILVDSVNINLIPRKRLFKLRRNIGMGGPAPEAFSAFLKIPSE